LGFTK